MEHILQHTVQQVHPKKVYLDLHYIPLHEPNEDFFLKKILLEANHS